MSGRKGAGSPGRGRVTTSRGGRRGELPVQPARRLWELYARFPPGEPAGEPGQPGERRAGLRSPAGPARVTVHLVEVSNQVETLVQDRSPSGVGLWSPMAVATATLL